MPLSPAPIQNLVTEETGFATRPWVLWAQGLYSTVLNHSDMLEFIDQKPRGVACMENNTSVTTISSTNAPVKVAGSLTASANNRKFSVSNDRLEYIGDKNIVFDIYAVSSIEKQSSSGGVETYRLDIYKNGVRVSCGGSISSLTNNRLIEVTSMADVELSTGDYIEIFITNLTGTSDIIVESMTLKAVY